MIALSIVIVKSERAEAFVDASSIWGAGRGAGTSAGDECVWSLLYTAAHASYLPSPLLQRGTFQDGRMVAAEHRRKPSQACNSSAVNSTR